MEKFLKGARDGGHLRACRGAPGSSRRRRSHASGRGRAATGQHVRGRRRIRFGARREWASAVSLPPSSWRRSAGSRRRFAAATRCAWKWWCAPGASATSSRAARWMPSTVWVELQARDNKGRVIFWSGKVEDDGHGPVEPGAHFYRSLQLDGHGNPINKRNAWATRAVMYARLIPPGAADTVHFRLRVPKDCGDTITLTAKLNYRKFSWWNTQWAFAGIPDPTDKDRPSRQAVTTTGAGFSRATSRTFRRNTKEIPDVPIVVMSEAAQTVPVVAKNAAAISGNAGARSRRPRALERLRHWTAPAGRSEGRGASISEGDETRASYADGWVNVARARVQEGNTEAAKPFRAEGHRDSIRAWRARITSTGWHSKPTGNTRRLTKSSPRPQRSIRATAWCATRWAACSSCSASITRRSRNLSKTLAVDPEDLEAHYNLMLCYRGLGNDALADREEKLYLRFKADEARAPLPDPSSSKSPHDNNEAQPIHEHVSVPLEKAEGRKQYAEGRRETPRRAMARAGTPPVQKWRGGGASR